MFGHVGCSFSLLDGALFLFGSELDFSLLRGESLMVRYYCFELEIGVEYKMFPFSRRRIETGSKLP